MKLWKKITLIISLLFVIAIGYGTYYFTFSYPTTTTFQQELTAYNYKSYETYIYFPAEKTDAPAIVLYQGARVEPESYFYLANGLQQKGYNVFISKMPFNWAFLNMDLFSELTASYQEIDEWYIGGHSLGGSMAAEEAYKNIENPKMKGLIFLASYSAKNFSKTDVPMLFIFGENDGLVTKEKRTKYLENQSRKSYIHIITGGNHAQFGIYGEQSGDNAATISVGEQQNEIIETIAQWILSSEKQ